MLINTNLRTVPRERIMSVYLLYKNRKTKSSVARLKTYYKNFEKEYLLELEQNPNLLLESSAIANELYKLNRPLVLENYKSLINHPWIKEDVLNQRIVNKLVDKELERTVQAELEVIQNNINFIHNQIKNAEINLERFKELEKEPLITTRERLELASSNGLNIPTQGFGSDTYYNIDKLFDSYARRSENISDYESAEELNRLAEEKGEPLPYTHKRWVWQCLDSSENTRHEGMDGVVVEFDEMFNVVNDLTGESEHLRFASDPEGSPQAVYNCMCCTEYFKE